MVSSGRLKLHVHLYVFAYFALIFHKFGFPLFLICVYVSVYMLQKHWTTDEWYERKSNAHTLPFRYVVYKICFISIITLKTANWLVPFNPDAPETEETGLQS